MRPFSAAGGRCRAAPGREDRGHDRRVERPGAAPAGDPLKINLRVILAFTLVHFTGDFYSAFTTPLFPLFVEKLGLSLIWVYAGAALAGGMVLATLPLGVVMAQTLAPRGRSMVGSLMMGFAFGLGGIVAPLVGSLADAFSVRTVLGWISLVPLLTLFLIARFPTLRGGTS